MGVKKSTVCTSAISGVIRYTPASSPASKPTRTLGSDCFGSVGSTESKILGLNLAAQPAAFTMAVNRFRSSITGIIGSGVRLMWRRSFTFAIRRTQMHGSLHGIRHFLKTLHGELEILPRVRGGNLHADARLALRHHGIGEADHVDALL